MVHRSQHKIMKDAVNYFIPIVQDPMNDITGRCITHHVSSNGYYGFHPMVPKETPIPPRPAAVENMETENDSDIQFHNMIESEDVRAPTQIQNSYPRKRPWECDAEMPDCKKRRENEMLVTLEKQPPADLNTSAEVQLVENLLRETHGCNMYHWLANDVL